MAKSARLNLRLSDQDEALIRRAADAAQATKTEFVLASAREAAQRELADRTSFELDARAWDEFTELLERPVSSSKPGLRRLLGGSDSST
ncbi:MAG: DUF1778 domain-containing protein [Thermoleophilaceae bacterium]